MRLYPANSPNHAIGIAIQRDHPHIHSPAFGKQNKAPPDGNPPDATHRESPMFTAKQFRVKAAESDESLKHTDVPSEIREFQRSKESFSALAENEDWLKNNFDKIIHSQGTSSQDDDTGKAVTPPTVAETEEHILRCLGAAVIMQWNTIPTKLQRELFDTAGSMGDVLKSAALRAQIARFLHTQKDGDGVSDCVSNPSTPKGTPHGA
jgi:hypothetical protein